MWRPTRRRVIAGGAAIAAGARLTSWPVRAEADEETHGLSSFGDLKYGPDFPHFAYVNPQAPKGGTLVLQIKQATGNQSFDTFNTLNIFVLRGDGAAGMGATFDTLMAGSADEAGTLYGLVARNVRISPDKLIYRFLLRPEARFHDGSRLTARDAAFSLNILKEKGHPTFRAVLREVAAAEAEADDVLRVTFTPQRSRDLHLVVAGMPIFSEAYW
jgi:microcin C transport system substrate-binding protein